MKSYLSNNRTHGTHGILQVAQNIYGEASS